MVNLLRKHESDEQTLVAQELSDEEEVDTSMDMQLVTNIDIECASPRLQVSRPCAHNYSFDWRALAGSPST
jgi:hypothetical protein